MAGSAIDNPQKPQGRMATCPQAAGPRLPVVLVVDDDADVLGMVRRQVSRCGCHVLAAGSPEEAQTLAASAGPLDLLVTDVMMPGMPGPELFRRLASAIPGLRVIYMSGCPDRALEFPEISADQARFLAKPFSTAEMATTIRDALGTPPA